MGQFKRIRYFKDANGKIVPYVSYYTQHQVNDGDLTINTESEEYGEIEEDGEDAVNTTSASFDYEPGIYIPAYGDRFRHELPQINYKTFFNKMGPDKFSRRKIKLEQLTPTQCEFSEKKVIDIIENSDGDLEPILISKDCKIIDGHHRWLAIVNMGYQDIEANQIDMDYDDVMSELDADPDLAETKTVYEGVLLEAEYKGKKVSLGKPFRTPGENKKFAVYVKNKNGKVVIVRFGDSSMKIRRDDPERRKNFRARHKCSTRTDRTSPSHWSCKFWAKTPVSKLAK